MSRSLLKFAGGSDDCITALYFFHDLKRPILKDLGWDLRFWASTKDSNPVGAVSSSRRKRV
jgi:hypothetical protein